MKHIILGAGGAIGTPLANVLLREKESVTLLSRSAKSVQGAETASVDILNPASVRAAVEADSVVYLLVGLEYNIKVWREHWITAIKNAVEACAEKGAKLIFFDNVYITTLVH